MEQQNRCKLKKIIEVSRFLEISQSTVRNWVRKKLIPDDFNMAEIEKLKQKIDNGEIEILNKRANKTNSKSFFIPIEYINNIAITAAIKKICSLAMEKFSNINDYLYNICLCYLIEKQEFMMFFENYEFKRKIIKTILENNFPDSKINLQFIESALTYFLKLRKNNCNDVLGILYQSYCSEGIKSKQGSYYTPHYISDDINRSLTNIKTYYDPCCGTGSFLLSAIKILNINPENIYGSDIDKIAVFIAKLNILIQFPEMQEEPNIFHVDIIDKSSEELQKTFKNKFDAIVTNPPWGAAKNKNKYHDYKEFLKSNEVFSMFILLSIKLLKNNGETVLVLPKSILNIRTHSKIRQFILENTKIISITEIGKTFSNVFTDVILLQLKKEIPDENHKINIYSKTQNFKFLQQDFFNNKDFKFEINLNNEEKEIIEKLYSVPHKTLKQNAIWGLGIITGNNSEFLSKTKTPDNEIIIKGTDVDFYKLKEPEYFIKYQPENLQQVAKEKIYRAKEKIIYKFISDFFVFAYDNNGFLTLNSANCLIPYIEDYSIKTVLAFLNSSVHQFIFAQKIASHKILKNDLETLPFPILDTETKENLEILVDQAINGKNVKNEIDNIIFETFNLSKKEIQIIISKQNKNNE